nr:hypothetical protein [Tanacetum cinerariifolium]
MESLNSNFQERAASVATNADNANESCMMILSFAKEDSCVLLFKTLRFAQDRITAFCLNPGLRFVKTLDITFVTTLLDYLQGSQKESGFKRAFATLSGQDTETFTGTMFLNVEQLEKQLDKEDFQEIGSMNAFKVLETQFQMFLTNRDYLNDEYVAMTRSYFIQYTGHVIPEFHDILIQHLESVKKSIDERVQLKREYASWVNERKMRTIEEKVDTSKALDASSVDTECSRRESKEQDTSNRSGNDAHDDDVDIRPIYDEELMAEVQTTAEIDVFTIGQQYTDQLEFNNEGGVVQNAEECHDTYPLPAIVTNNQIPEHSYQSLEYKNSCLKKTVAQFQKDFLRLEAHCVNLELKY